MSDANGHKPLGLFHPIPGEDHLDYTERVFRRLRHAELTGRPDMFDTEGPVYFQPELLSDAELHRFGINLVAYWMSGHGYETVKAEYDPERQPQITADLNGERFHVLVRTACYPNKGTLEEDWVEGMVPSTLLHPDARCFFASVSLCNAAGTTPETMARPVRTAPFHMSFGGLEPLPRPLRNATLLTRDPGEYLDS